MKENSTPRFVKARKVSFNLLPLVETPAVPVLKKDMTIRLCGDFSVTLNQCLVVDQYPLPTTDDLCSSLAGGEKFSKIDLKQAYLQMEIHPDDRELLTLNTRRGLYRSTRLLYGIASAPAV